VKIEHHITADATPEQVWAVLSDLDAWPEWLPTVVHLEREHPETPHGVGAGYLLNQPRLASARWVITDWKPGRGFTWTSSGSLVSTTATHELSATPSGGTEIELGIEWSGPLSKPLGLLARRPSRRHLEEEADALVARVVPFGT